MVLQTGITDKLRMEAWQRHSGDSIKSVCKCCKSTNIDMISCYFGQLYPVAKGSKIESINLLPVCQACFASAGEGSIMQCAKFVSDMPAAKPKAKAKAKSKKDKEESESDSSEDIPVLTKPKPKPRAKKEDKESPKETPKEVEASASAEPKPKPRGRPRKDAA